MPNPAKFYGINLVRDLRESEVRQERQRKTRLLLAASCYITLLLSIGYSGLTMWKMESILAKERKKLINLTNEYRKYTASRLIVEKGDVELLNSLQGRGIFWTKKLAALATHLPEGYWISKFSYSNDELKVSGFGQATTRQDQLLILDGYLNMLRHDSTFSDVFKHIYLNRCERTDEESEGKIAFEFSATKKPLKGVRSRSRS